MPVNVISVCNTCHQSLTDHRYSVNDTSIDISLQRRTLTRLLLPGAGYHAVTNKSIYQRVESLTLHHFTVVCGPFERQVL